MDVKREMSAKRTNQLARKRKPSDELLKKDTKIQRVEKETSKRDVNRKVTSTLTRRATICSVVDRNYKISWEDFNEGNSKISDRRLCRFNSPLPCLEWSDSFETWKSMVLKESENVYKRSEKLFMRHPCLQPRMRAILFDWLNEVCDVYKMQRRCLYLAIDFTDRYLSRVRDIQKKSLQLIGVTALFIASKSEEIYPPKLSDFSFITDGACSLSDILKQELEMIQVLNWKLSPVTPVCWVACFLQIIYTKPPSEFLVVQFEQNLFIRICRLLDLCILNSESIRFSYYMLAAAAVSFYIRNKQMLLKITALTQEQMAECKEWMQPYYKVLLDQPNVVCSSIHDIPQEAAHNIQTHIVNLDLLDAVRETNFSQQLVTKDDSNHLCSDICGSLSDSIKGVLTPPKSTEMKQKSSQPLHSISQDDNLTKSTPPDPV